MKEKARELQKARQEATRKGRAPGFGSSGFGSSGNSGGGSNYSPSIVGDTAPTVPETQTKAAYNPPSRPTASNKALKLGSKNKDIDTFVDMLKSEGETVTTSSGPKQTVAAKTVSQTPTESIHLRCEEKITVIAKRDGGLENMELHGLITLNISDEKYDRIRIKIDDPEDNRIQMVTHPNIDKEAFKTSHCIALKNPSKSFPLNTGVGVLKWRFQTQDDSNLPLMINCWPSENGNGGCDVNIEYSLEQDHLELSEVEITIPVPSGSNPIVSECEGMYDHDSRKNNLYWKLPVIDQGNKSGSMEFTCAGRPSEFFPINVYFVSSSPFCNVKVMDVTLVDSGEPVNYSSEVLFCPERYEIA